MVLIVSIGGEVQNAQRIHEYHILAPHEPTVEDLDCFARNIYFEARNESTAGQVAVGHTVLNRVWSTQFPNSICGVIKQGKHRGEHPVLNRCHFSWYCDGKPDEPRDGKAWDRSVRLAKYMLKAKHFLVDITDGSTYYHAQYVTPSWSRVLRKTAVIDTHIFYK